ncbi:hypothetical protein NLJ89_g7862 [Agrocybe chaxingu]|uniref:Uncharacterized protein n=1 Tax=Agrocybe chaxingu TaxID=84603 RepID=A0A9W8JWG9_9AGAR|nr:hypothetical protein NLJ89_g7862 [Agrocybe chaxingu]
MPASTDDPNLAVCPDFGADKYTPLREALISDQRSEEQAIEFLKNDWKARNDEEKLAWQARLDQEATNAAEEARIAKDAEAAALLAKRQEQLQEHEAFLKEEAKKYRNKHIPIDPNRPIPTMSSSTLSPAPPVLAKLLKGDYVPLWHFTNTGIKSGVADPGSLETDKIDFMRGEDGSVTALPASSLKVAPVDDSALSWEQFSHAVPRALEAMENTRWPSERILMFERFWTGILARDLGFNEDPLDYRTLLRYQSEQRKRWHVALTSIKGPYNLAEINETVMDRTRDQVYREERRRRDDARPVFGTTVMPPLLHAMDRHYRSARVVSHSASTGSAPNVKVPPTPAVTYAPVASQRCMELSAALEQRRLKPCTPYHADEWAVLLHDGQLTAKYPDIVNGLRQGFFGIGPVVHWVDDHLFFRIPHACLEDYNQVREQWHRELSILIPNHSGGRIWFGGTVLPDGAIFEMVEDCSFPLQDFCTKSRDASTDGDYTYSLADIDRLSERLGIPWEASKDVPFGSSPPYIGLIWDLDARSVSLAPAKVAKYTLAIEKWFTSPTHVLEEVQKLYGKLLHACLVIPSGRARLTGLEAMLGIFDNCPFMPRHAPASVRLQLQWWLNRFTSTPLARRIPVSHDVTDIGAFSDASSEVGIAVVIGGRWRAWRLLPGWRTLNGQRDIAWAEAVGFEFLVDILTQHAPSGQRFKVHGDNKGVVEGWWNGRSRNGEVNSSFERTHDRLESRGFIDCVFTSYIESAANPADKPSRGIYPSQSLLLPPVTIPDPLRQLVVDADQPFSPTEIKLQREGRYPAPAPKLVSDTDRAARNSFNTIHFREQLGFSPDYLSGLA